MKPTTYLNTALVLTAAGLLFSGYLSAVKFFTATCAFNEPCPLFLGYPACWFGFAMFAGMFIASVRGLTGEPWVRRAAWITALISLAGILFAGSLTAPELGNLMAGATYSLGLPTCAYGLILYVIIFVLSLTFLFREKQTGF